LLSASLDQLSDHGFAYFELTNSRFLVENAATVNLYHEYPQYFSETSMAILLGRFGFYVLETIHYLGGEMIGIIAKKTVVREPRQAKLNILNGYRNVWIWGVSGRTVHFLTHNRLDPKAIRAGVDIDPKKQGKFVPFTGQRICSPEECVADAPDALIVLNARYVPEVAARFPYRIKILTERDFYDE